MLGFFIWVSVALLTVAGCNRVLGAPWSKRPSDLTRAEFWSIIWGMGLVTIAHALWEVFLR